MEWPLTAGLAAGFIAIAVFCGWMGARPPNLDKGPRMIPYRGLMLLMTALAIFMLIHLAALFGLVGPR